MMQYEIHPLCKVLPEMPADRYTELVNDIRRKGLMRAITLYDGMILDGRHRYMACKDAGREPVFDEYTGSDPLGFVASSCCHRDLSKSQRAMIAASFLEYEREQAKARLKTNQSGERGLPPENLPEAGEARDKAGARMGVSGKTVDQAEKVIEKARPEVVQLVRSGDMALNEAVKVVELNPTSQKRIASISDKRERAKALSESLNCSRSKRAQNNRVETPALPGTPFVRELLGSLERTTVRLASEYKLKSADDIADKFLEEFDWQQEQLQAQLKHVTPLLRGLASIYDAVVGKSSVAA